MSTKLIKPVYPYCNVPPIADRLTPTSLMSTDRSQLGGPSSLRRTGMLGQICSREAAHHRVTTLHGLLFIEICATVRPGVQVESASAFGSEHGRSSRSGAITTLQWAMGLAAGI